MNTLASHDFFRVFDILQYQQKKYPQQHALNYFSENKWHGISTEEIQRRADIVACWWIENGYMPGDCVGIIPKMGSPDWIVIDFACQQAGLIVVPLHPTSSLEEMEFIVSETEAKVCLATDAELYQRSKPLLEKIPTLHSLFHLEKNQEGYFPALNVKNSNSEIITKLIHRRDAIRPEDTLAILYTSGTSGTPKGALLSHDNVVKNIKSILPIFPLKPGDRVFSFLPFSHIFERTSCYTYIAFGVSVYFGNNRERISQDFATVRPVFCTSVPKTLERMYDFLQEQRMEKNRVRRKLIGWAIDVGERYQSEKKIKLFFGLKLFIARILVLYRWRKALGGKIRYVVVGAAALRPEIGRLFSAAGVQVLSGYGMTEASPFIAVNRPEPGMNCFGTVGLPVPGVDIRLDDPNENGEGEILVRGPNVMQGYFKRPELNEQVFADGWLRTGDVGKMVNKRFLAITDRKKDIFKTSSGIYIAPQPLQNHFMASPFILQCLIIGFNRPFVSAILVPHFSILQAWCEENGIHWTSPTFMIHNIKVVKKIQEEIDRLNEPLQNFQRVRKFILSDTEWTVENGGLTTSFKPIRDRLVAKHTTDIEKIYQ